MSVSPSSHAVKRKAWDLNPHDPKVARFSKPARRAVSGYLPYVFKCQWTHRESNPDFQSAELVSSRWTMSPCHFSGPPGSRTPITWVQTKRLSVGPAAHHREVRSGVEPDLRLYHGRVLPEHLQTNFKSDRGWNRTIDLLVVTQASSPLDHATVQ